MLQMNRRLATDSIRSASRVLRSSLNVPPQALATARCSVSVGSAFGAFQPIVWRVWIQSSICQCSCRTETKSGIRGCVSINVVIAKKGLKYPSQLINSVEMNNKRRETSVATYSRRCEDRSLPAQPIHLVPHPLSHALNERTTCLSFGRDIRVGYPRRVGNSHLLFLTPRRGRHRPIDPDGRHEMSRTRRPRPIRQATSPVCGSDQWYKRALVNTASYACTQFTCQLKTEVSSVHGPACLARVAVLPLSRRSEHCDPRPRSSD